MSRNIYFEFFNVLSLETKHHLAKIYAGDKIPVREIFDAVLRRNSCVTQKVRRCSYILLPEQTSFMSNLQSRSTPKIKKLAAVLCCGSRIDVNVKEFLVALLPYFVSHSSLVCDPFNLFSVIPLDSEWL